MVGGDHGGTHACAARTAVGLQRGIEDFRSFLVGVGIGSADVDHKAAFVGHDIVLTTRLDLGDTDLYRSERGGNPLESELPQPGYVVECDVKRVDTLIACGMSALAVRHAVEHDQSAFGYRRLQ